MPSVEIDRLRSAKYVKSLSRILGEEMPINVCNTKTSEINADIPTPYDPYSDLIRKPEPKTNNIYSRTVTVSTDVAVSLKRSELRELPAKLLDEVDFSLIAEMSCYDLLSV